MLRKTLSAAGLLRTVRSCFERIEDAVSSRGGASLTDCLLSALAVFGMKCPSLLQFRPGVAERWRSARQPAQPLRGGAGAVGHADARASERGGCTRPAVMMNDPAVAPHAPLSGGGGAAV